MRPGGGAESHRDHPPQCCDYHSYDWNVASGLAVTLVREATEAGLEGRMAVLEYAKSRMRDLELSPEDQRWTVSLLRDEIVLFRDRTGYRNGRHRAQAMKDLGVAETIIAID